MVLINKFFGYVILLCGCILAQTDSSFQPSQVGSIISLDSLQPTPQDSQNATDNPPPIEKMPILIKFVKANYPDSLIKKGIEGIVELDLVVSTEGNVDSVSVVNGIHPTLDTNASKAAKTFLFTPAISQGKPIPVIMRYRYGFTLNDVMSTLQDTINFQGLILEKGTRLPVNGCFVILSFEDTLPSNKSNNKNELVDKTPCGIPLVAYLERIGTKKGQKIEEGKLVSTTDSLGHFSFYSLPTGNLHIRINAFGYKPFTTQITIKKGKTAKAKYWLERDFYNQNEIVVYGKGEDLEVQTYDVAQEEIKRIPGFYGESAKIIQALPGVSRPIFGGNEIIIRGNDNVNSKVYLDGLELPYLYHDMSNDWLMYRGIINANILNSLSLLPGGWGANYGNALGGIIEMNSRAARLDKWHTTIDVSIKSCDLLFESPLWKNASIIGSFRGNYFFNVQSYFQRRFLNIPSNQMKDFWDYSIRFDWRIKPEHHVFISTIGAVDTAYMKSSYWQQGRKMDTAQEAFSFGKKLTMGILGWDWNISNKWDNMLRCGIRPSSYRTRENEWGDFKYERYSSSLRSDFRDELHYAIKENVKMTIGLDMHYEPYADSSKFINYDTTFTTSQKRLLGPLSGYVSLELKPLDKLTVVPGLRYDYYPQLTSQGQWLPEFFKYDDRYINNHTRVSGDPSIRLSSKYQLQTKQTLTASLGTYNQSPDSVIILFGDNKGVSTEKGCQFTLGHQWKITDLLSLESESYVNYQWNRPRSATSAEISANNVPVLYSNGKARMEGLELMFKRDQDKNFFGWVSYSLAYSERYDFRSRKWVEYDYNVLNNIQAIGNFFLPWNMCFGLRFQYTEGYPYTPWESQLYDATYFTYVPKAGVTNSKRHTPYYGLDLRLEKKWILKMGILTGYIEFMRVIHWFQFIKDKNGVPIYQPGEMETYNYDYSGFQTIPGWPMASLGLTWEF